MPFEDLQRFLGYVLSIGGGHFSGIMADETVPSNPLQEMTFDLHSVRPAERGLIKLGAIFEFVVANQNATIRSCIKFSSQDPIDEKTAREAFEAADKRYSKLKQV